MVKLFLTGPCDQKTVVLLEYPPTTGFQWGHLKSDSYTYTVSGGNNMVF